MNAAITKRKLALINPAKSARRKKLICKIVSYTVLSLLAVSLIFPYVFMVNRSFMTVADVTDPKVKLFPAHFTLDAYTKLFAGQNYAKYLWNTVKIILINIVTIPLASSLCAYGFAKIKFDGRKIVFAAVMSTLMIPGAIIQVPLYVTFAKLGWTKSALPLMIPGMFGGGAVNIFLLMQFMRNIPNEIENAAQIDGAGAFKRYLLITMPLCVPILLFVVIGTFAACWSDFYNPLIYLKNTAQYTLAIKIYYDSTLTNVASVYANVRMAAGVFMSLIPALIFFAYQRKLVDGIFIGAIKM